MSAQAGVGILTSPRLSDCVSDWIPLGSRVCMLKLKVLDRSLCILQIYTPNATSEYQAFVDEVNDALLRVSGTESTVLMGDFRPEMLKVLTGKGILWLTRVCQVTWTYGKTLRDLQTGVIIPIFKKGDRKQCKNCWGISLLSLRGKVYAKCLEKECREMVESKLNDGLDGFCPDRWSSDEIFTLKEIFEKSWQYGKDLFACFVDFGEAHDRVPWNKLWKVLWEYGFNVQLLRAIKSFY